MINIIGINGYIGSGKDVVGSMIKDIAYSIGDDDKWQIKKFAFKLKQIASLMLGVPVELFEDQEFKMSNLPIEWNYKVVRKLNSPDIISFSFESFEEKNMTVREFLQKLGTEAIRDNLHKNAWVNALFADYKEGDKWIITDCRFPNEAEAIKSRGGIIIRVNRFDYAGKNLHPSETSLDDWKFDYIIDNKAGLEELEDKVTEFLKVWDIPTWG